MTRLHPEARAHVESACANAFADLVPPPEDPVEMSESAALCGWTVDELREARAAYQSWTTVEEWREQRSAAIAATVWALVNTPRTRNWRRWRLTRSLLRQLYAIGIVSGYGTEFGWHGAVVRGVSWSGAKNTYTGRRNTPVYVLWVKRDSWRCLLKGHHWPSQHKVGFGLCTRCCPCPLCGNAAPLEHDCTETDAT